MMAAVSTAFVSCGNKDEKSSDSKDSKEKLSIDIKPESTKISGDLRNCFEVVDREYTATDDWGLKLAVEVKRTNDELPSSFKGCDNIVGFGTFSYEENVQIDFTVELLDDKGNIIDNASASSYSHEVADVFNLAKDETGSFTVSFSVFGNEDKLAKATKFRVKSKAKHNDESERPAASASSDDSSSSSYSSDDDDDDSGSSSSYSSDDDDDDNTSSSVSSAYNSAKSQVKDAYNSAKSQAKDAIDKAAEEAFGNNAAAKAAAKAYGKALDKAMEDVDDALDDW